MPTTDICKASSANKIILELSCTCPIQDLEISSIKRNKTQPQSRGVSAGGRAAACWQRCTRMQISSGCTWDSAGAASNKEPAAPESLLSTKIRTSEHGRTSRSQATPPQDKAAGWWNMNDPTAGPALSRISSNSSPLAKGRASQSASLYDSPHHGFIPHYKFRRQSKRFRNP